jgi:hypothetical protein
MYTTFEVGNFSIAISYALLLPVYFILRPTGAIRKDMTESTNHTRFLFSNDCLGVKSISDT